MSDPLSSAARLINGGCPLEAFVQALNVEALGALASACTDEKGAREKPSPAPSAWSANQARCHKCGLKAAGVPPPQAPREAHFNGDRCCCPDCHTAAVQTSGTQLGSGCHDCPLLVRS